MKYTNIKKLLIKFMGGGLINFPTRFLRWVKIDGDADSDGGSDDGEDGSENNSNIFFQLAAIQPSKYEVYLSENEPPTLIDIKNLDLNTFIDYYENGKNINFVYSKEELTKLGFSLEELEALENFDINNIEFTENNSIRIDGSIIRNNFIIYDLSLINDDTGYIIIEINKIHYTSNNNYYITRYPFGDNNDYVILKYTDGPNQ